MGNYRTTMYRRDFNRLQAQRNQAFPKGPVSVKEKPAQLGKEAILKPADKLETEPQLLTSLSGSDLAKVEPTSEISDERQSVNQVSIKMFYSLFVSLIECLTKQTKENDYLLIDRCIHIISLYMTPT